MVRAIVHDDFSHSMPTKVFIDKKRNIFGLFSAYTGFMFF